MSTGWALVVSLVLLVANAFFVAAEFALVASKRHRLEEAAASGSRAARAAIEGTRELSLMLAGAQLGITLCTLGLGALAKPAVANLLNPVFTTLGLSDAWAYPVAFVLAVAIVVFLHMVVGEMAPKSWAISHPERSATLLALPFRAFTRAMRPVLAVLNGMANATLRAVGVQPQDTVASAHGPDDLRLLLRESKEHGLLPDQQHHMLTGVLRVRSTTIAQVMSPATSIVTVPDDAPPSEVERVSRESGRSRLILANHKNVVHVREAIRATDKDTTALDLSTEVLTLPHTTPVSEAVTHMRANRAQLTLVTDTNKVIGLASLEDLLEEILGDFDDETDT